MTLETLKPEPTWDPESHATALGTLEAWADAVTVRVWCGDWCPDCRRELPPFGAALRAAGVPGDRIHEYPVEKDDDGRKHGPNVEDYGIEYIPTVVLERDGEEVARYVEPEDRPILEHLVAQLEPLDAPA